jgi:hypothetical protein
MLTRDDETIADARAVYERLAGTGVRHVGCKDIGVPRGELEALLGDIRANGHTSYLEVVSETREATLASARVAVAVGPDYLIGGTLVEPVQEIIAGTGIRFFPYIGRIVGHPCLLRGSIGEIVEEARRVEAAGVDGINLLAYRFDGDVSALVVAVAEATRLDLICAGSVDSLERIGELVALEVWAFTVGTAILDRRIVAGASLEAQVEATLRAARRGV